MVKLIQAISYDQNEAVNLLRRFVVMDDVADALLHTSVMKPLFNAIERATHMDNSFARNMRTIVTLEILDTFLRKLHSELSEYVSTSNDQHDPPQGRKQKKRRKQQPKTLDSVMVCQTIDAIMKMDLSKSYNHFQKLVAILLELRCHAIVLILLSTPPTQAADVYRRHVDVIRENEFYDDHEALKNEAIDSFKLIGKAIRSHDATSARRYAQQFTSKLPAARLLGRFVKLMLSLRAQLGPIPVCRVPHAHGHLPNAHGQKALFSDEEDSEYNDDDGNDGNDADGNDDDDDDDDDDAQLNEIYEQSGDDVRDDPQDVIEIDDHGSDLNHDLDERERDYSRDRGHEDDNINHEGMDVDVDAYEIDNEPVARRAATKHYDYDNDLGNRGAKYVHSAENEDDSDASSRSPQKDLLGPKSMKILHTLDKRVFATVVPKSKQSRKTMRRQAIPQADPVNYSDAESPNSDQYDGDNDDDGTRDKDGDGDNESQPAAHEAEKDDEVNEIDNDGDEHDNIEDRKRKRHANQVLNNLHDRSQALKQKYGRDPLDSARRTAESIPRIRRRIRSLDRPSSNARDASPIPDLSPITRRTRRANVELPASDDDDSDYSRLERIQQRQRKEREEEVEYINGLRIKKGKFTKQEDQWLVEGLLKYGWGSWSKISRNFGGGQSVETRSGMSLKDRARTLELDPVKYRNPVASLGAVRKRGRPPGSASRMRSHHEEDNNDPIDEDEDEDKDEDEEGAGFGADDRGNGNENDKQDR